MRTALSICHTRCQISQLPNVPWHEKHPGTCPKGPGLTWKEGVDASLNPVLPFLSGSGALERACQSPPDLFWSLPTVWHPYSHATHCVPGPCARDASGGDRESRPSSSLKLLRLRSCQLPTQGPQACPPAPQHLPAYLPGGPPAPSRGLGSCWGFCLHSSTWGPCLPHSCPPSTVRLLSASPGVGGIMWTAPPVAALDVPDFLRWGTF